MKIFNFFSQIENGDESLEHPAKPIQMTAVENRSICGVLSQDVVPFNDTTAFINDAVLAAVNVPLCVFALLSNLIAIVAVVKTPSLHIPSYIWYVVWPSLIVSRVSSRSHSL